MTPHLLRVCIENTLALIAERDAQLHYQAQSPGLDVSTELFLQWEDWYRPRSPEFLDAFDASEASTLRAFHAIFTDVRNDVFETVPSIAQFVETAAWRRISDAARATQALLRSALKAA